MSTKTLNTLQREYYLASLEGNLSSGVTVEQVEGMTGYYGILTDFFFGGSGTTTEISTIDTWTDVNFTVHDTGSNEGLFDKRPPVMVEANAAGTEGANKTFLLEGLTTNAFCNFKSGFLFNPDVDGGKVEARLLFERHSGTVPADNFPIETVALQMESGADIEYPSLVELDFFVGDTIDTNAAGDAGKCRFQIKSDVTGTLTMKELVWYINKGKVNG